jgi:hypothetical protein
VRSGASYAAFRAAKVGGCGIGGSNRRAEATGTVLELADSMVEEEVFVSCFILGNQLYLEVSLPSALSSYDIDIRLKWEGGTTGTRKINP